MFYYLMDYSEKPYMYACKDPSSVWFDRSLCENCGRMIGIMRYAKGPRRFVLEGGTKYPDLLGFHGAGERLFILSDKALSVFEQHHVSGLGERERIQVLSRKGEMLIEPTETAPGYWLVQITGCIELSFSDMFLKKKRKCAYCGRFDWNRQRLRPLILDASTWNGNDFCRVVSIPGYIVCTDTVMNLVKEYSLSGFDFTALIKTGDGSMS